MSLAFPESDTDVVEGSVVSLQPAERLYRPCSRHSGATPHRSRSRQTFSCCPDGSSRDPIRDLTYRAAKLIALEIGLHSVERSIAATVTGRGAGRSHRVRGGQTDGVDFRVNR